jgi:Raf kinase inhibitor-like YbhB/YbcL family protein
MNPLTVRLPITHFPPNYTCDGADISPAIEIRGIDDAVRSLALIVNDPDASGGRFIHWLCWNMEVVSVVPEDIPKEPEITFPIQARQGMNDFGRIGYGGPCPPHGKAHRYVFKVYGLDAPIEVPQGARYPEVAAALEGHVLQYGEAQALYGR